MSLKQVDNLLVPADVCCKDELVHQSEHLPAIFLFQVLEETSLGNDGMSSVDVVTLKEGMFLQEDEVGLCGRVIVTSKLK